MFARSTLAVRPVATAAWRTLGASALRTALPAVSPALSASLHVSARAPLQTTRVASVDAESAAEPASEQPAEPKDLHDHPRIWEDVHYSTLGQLLNPSVEGGEGHKIATDTVLLDFYADWCGPCKALSPLLTKLAKEEGLNTSVISLDVDKNPEIAQAFQITALPTVYGIYQNKPVRRCT